MPFGNLVQEAASAQLKEFNGVYLRNYSLENRKVLRGQAALALKQLKQLHARCAVRTHCNRKNSTYIPLKYIDKILAEGVAAGGATRVRQGIGPWRVRVRGTGVTAFTNTLAAQPSDGPRGSLYLVLSSQNRLSYLSSPCSHAWLISGVVVES